MDEEKHKNRILEALSKMATLLLRMKDVDSSMSETLRSLGKAVGVSRTYIFSNREDLEGRILASQRWEWVNEGVSAHIDNPKFEDFCYADEGFGRWVELLSKGEPVFGPIEGFPESEHSMLSSRNTFSLAVAPIFTAEVWWGFIGFDDCSSAREWSEAELYVFSTAAELIGAALERLNMERQLRYWNEFNKNIIESTSVGVYVIDKNARIQVWNRGMEEQFGVEAAEVLGENIFRAFPVLEEEELGRILRHCIEEETGYSESRLIHCTRQKGERILDVKATPLRDFDGRVSGVVVINSDVTAQHEAEQKLAESAEMYHSTTDSMADIIHVVDSDMRIVMHNTALRLWAVNLGLELDKVIGRDLFEIFPFLPNKVKEEYEQVWHKGKPLLTLETTVIGNQTVFTETRKIPVKDKKGDVERIVTVIRDITERKRSEEELSTLLEITTAVSATLDEKEVTRLIAERAAEFIKADGCTIYRFDHNTKELVPQTTTIQEDREKRLAYRIRLGEGVTGKAALEHKPILANNVHLSGEGIRIPGIKETPRCLLVAPLIAHGKLWGVMTLVRLSEEGFVERDLELFGLFTNQVADAAVNSTLFSLLGESEEKYRSFVEQATDGIVIIQDGRVVFANHAAALMVRYPLKEFIGMEYTRILAPEVREEMAERYRRRMAEEKVPSIYETKLLVRDGKVIDVELNAGLIHYEGRPADLVFARDIRERKGTEEALREREELYRTLVNSAEEGISLVDDREKFLFVNPKMANLLGYPPEELIGRNLLDFIPPEEVEFVKEETVKRTKGQVSRYETILIHKDGTPKRVLVNAAPILDADGRFSATLGVLTDITDLKQVEEELRLRLIYQTAFAQIMNRAIRIENFEEFINGCLEIVGNALDVSRVYLVTNSGGHKKEMSSSEVGEDLQARITHEWLSPGTSSLLRSDYFYSKIPYVKRRLLEDELIAASVSSLPSPDCQIFEGEAATAVIVAPLNLRDGFYGFIAAQECGRERRWSDSEIQAFRTAIRLITTVIERYFEEQERRLAEQALLESERRYRTLVETSSDVIFLISPQGRPLYISPAAAKMGYAPQDFLNRPRLFLKAIPKDELNMLWSVFARTMREGHPAQDVDCEVYDREGHRHWFAVSWNWMRDDEGRTIALQGVARDITERKQTERALRLRMEYEKALFEVSSLFLSEGVSEESLAEFLERLGKVTGVSRVYLFSHTWEEGRPLMKRSHRWASEEMLHLASDRMDKVYYDEGFGRWLNALSTGEAIHGLVDELPKSERKLFEREGILAILVLPIFVEGSFWGAIGFDEAKRKREWNIEDIRLLWTASQIFSSALATESKAKELALSYDDLQERERRISELNLRLVKAEEDERRRLSQVLHDDIAQQLTGVALALSGPELASDQKTQKRLNEAKAMVKQTQEFIRDLSYELRPPALDNLGLAAAVRALARSVAEAAGVSFVIEGYEDFPRTDPDTEIMLYRIIQEAANNSLKHAEPEEITVKFEYSKPILRVSVVDDGKGFDVESVMAASTGLGLRSIHERVALIGGKIELSSSLGRGTRVSVEIEIPRNSNKMSMEEQW